MAWALPLIAWLPQPLIVEPPSRKLTVPPLGVLVLLTVAVRVTEPLGAAVNDGFRFELSTVLVATAAAFTVKVRLQPLMETLLAVGPLLSIKYKLQVPLGFTFVKTPLVELSVPVPFGNESAVLPGANVPGPGEGKVSGSTPCEYEAG